MSSDGGTVVGEQWWESSDGGAVEEEPRWGSSGGGAVMGEQWWGVVVGEQWWMSSGEMGQWGGRFKKEEKEREGRGEEEKGGKTGARRRTHREQTEINKGF